MNAPSAFPSPSASLAERLRQPGHPHSHGRFFVTDIDGVCRGKHLSTDKLADMLEGGGTISSAVFGWDMADDLYTADVDFAHLHAPLGEVGLRLDPATARQIPWDDDRWVVLGEHLAPDGSPLPICPRQVLKGVLQRLSAAGYSAQVGVEFEWFVLQETEQSVRAKGYRGLHTATQGITNYSPFRIDAQKAFVADLFRWLPEADIPIEALHTEAGPGNFEAALRYGEALQSADRAVLFKQAVREIGRPHGLLNTFMAKWSMAYGGCGQHMHQSLWRDGQNVFRDAAAGSGTPSKALRHYIAGQLHALPHLMALYAPTVNSYKRLVDGMLAPVHANWAVDDRHASLRVVPGSAHSQRLETRVPGADANTYLAMAAAIASGLYGIQHQLEPGPARTASTPGPRLPRTLDEATELMAGSALARELLGAPFIDHFVQTRRWELRRFHSAVTDWELARYLELV